MTAELYPTFDATDIILEEDAPNETSADIIAPKFDGDNAVFTINNIGQAVIGDAEDAYQFWVVKCLLTERYKYLAYSDDFGVEMEEILRSDYPRDIKESEIERTIVEALTVDERTVSVTNFEFKWEGDAMTVHFLVESIYGTASYQYQRGGDDLARVQAA